MSNISYPWHNIIDSWISRTIVMLSWKRQGKWYNNNLTQFTNAITSQLENKSTTWLVTNITLWEVEIFLQKVKIWKGKKRSNKNKLQYSVDHLELGGKCGRAFWAHINDVSQLQLIVLKTFDWSKDIDNLCQPLTIDLIKSRDNTSLFDCC